MALAWRERHQRAGAVGELVADQRHELDHHHPEQVAIVAGEARLVGEAGARHEMPSLVAGAGYGADADKNVAGARRHHVAPKDLRLTIGVEVEQRAGRGGEQPRLAARDLKTHGIVAVRAVDLVGDEVPLLLGTRPADVEVMQQLCAGIVVHVAELADLHDGGTKQIAQIIGQG